MANKLKMKIEDDEDRLSSLHDSLLLEIVSKLPIKLAVCTSVLSKRWCNLWTQITCVYINHHHFCASSSNFFTIVDKFLSKLTSPIITTFILKLDDSLEFPSLMVDSWFRLICSKNIENIKVTIDRNHNCNARIVFIPPSCVLQTPSLLSLKWVNYSGCCKIPEVEVHLPKLKSFSLLVPLSQCWIVSRIARECPSLEYLWLAVAGTNKEAKDEAVIDITCHSLKVLVTYYCHPQVFTKFVIDAPNLNQLKFHVKAEGICSLVSKPRALQDVKLMVASKTLALSLLKQIMSVKHLTVSVSSISALKGLQEEDCLVYSNLQSLTLNMDYLGRSADDLSWSPLDTIPATFLTNVKVIKVWTAKVTNEANLINLTKCLLNSARVLEKFTFCVKDATTGAGKNGEALREMMFCSQLSCCSQSSPRRCKIEFLGKYVLMSDDGIKLRGDDGHIVSSQEVDLERNLET